MKVVRWFASGALAVPIFHQGMLALLNATGFAARQPYSMEPTAPFGVPEVLSLSFWGGVWGIILGMLLPDLMRGARYWLVALLFGVVAPTLVALFLVAPLKGQPSGGDAKRYATAALLNGAWGLGTAAIYYGWTRAARRLR